MSSIKKKKNVILLIVSLFIFLLIWFFMLLGYKINRIHCKSLICYTSRCQKDLCSYSVCLCFRSFIWFGFSSQLDVEILGNKTNPLSPLVLLPRVPPWTKPKVKQTGRSVPVWQQGYVKLAMQLFDV